MSAKRSNAVKVATAITATMAVTWMTGCGAPQNEADADYAQVCVDPETNQRVDDDRCDDDTHHSSAAPIWWYMPISSGSYGRMPAVGESVPNTALKSKPATGKTTTISKAGGSYAKAGSVARGGAGTGAKGGSGS